MPAKITAPVDCKRPEWQHFVDIAVRTGSNKALRGMTPEGLPPGGYWEYKRRAKKGRIYLAYKTREREYVIGSVSFDADLEQEWTPKPFASRAFAFDSGPVVVHYDAMALPCRIVGVRT